MGFLPRDLLYNNVNYDESKDGILSALNILEHAQEKELKSGKESEPDNRSGWDKFVNAINPFKCGQNGV